jgi:hypothetical protein
MDAAQMAQALDDVFDQAVVYHGFADFMRDYDLFIYTTADPQTGVRPQYLRYRFKYCVRASASTALPVEIGRAPSTNGSPTTTPVATSTVTCGACAGKTCTRAWGFGSIPKKPRRGRRSWACPSTR